MAAFASVELLQDRLQTDFDTLDRARAENLLDSATGIIKREARQFIEQVVDDVEVFPASSSSVLLLPELPVTAVSSVVAGSNPLTLTDDYLVDFTAGLLSVRYPAWLRWQDDVTVTYTHGYATVPDDLVAICVEMAARAWINPRGVLSEQIGTYSARFVNTKPGLVLLEHEEHIVRSYRPRP